MTNPGTKRACLDDDNDTKMTSAADREVKRSSVDQEKPAASGDLLRLATKEIWIQRIFSFVGMGHFAFVAPVSKQMKALYTEYCGTVKIPPVVVEIWYPEKRTRAAGIADTIYSAAFYNLQCAEYWYDDWNKSDDGIHQDFVCEVIAKVGSLAVLRWARETKEFSWDPDTCGYAAGDGHLEVLKYAHENGCLWDALTCSYAAEGGHLEVLKYAHENGCPWDEGTCDEAATYGRLEILQYAHENGCPWNEQTWVCGANGGNQEVMRYLMENHCPGFEDSSVL
ncbi:ankyrin repeat protein [Seminavis robusta]|uniref:Ankyrin repeat protein n=1 Tax=Seminavis robusta TaxID=568900 RepID=A0A9N8HH53_9STRA|nr:ankyrin repeat protein [Seminavis robusta]|eukprot:Sro543_g163600.1 ankyrin repeat protein (281) ;mRNA; r:44233-45075